MYSLATNIHAMMLRRRASVAPDPILALFASGEQGAALKIFKVETLFQDTALTTPSANTDPVGGIEDQSGNDKHATQIDAAARPARDGERIIVDGQDDNMSIDFTGSGGFAATLLHGTSEGVVEAKVNVLDGVWRFWALAGRHPSNNVTGLVLVEGTPDVSAAKAEIPGAGNKFAGVTSMQAWFRTRDDITELLMSDWDTSSVTSFSFFAQTMSSLTSLGTANMDTSSAEVFTFFISNCASLTEVDLSNWVTTSMTDMRFFADGASSLATVTVNGGTGNPFADSSCIKYDNAFTNTNLTQQSIDDILVAIEAAGTSNGTFDQSGGSAPSATGEAAITALRSRGWTVTVTGGF